MLGSLPDLLQYYIWGGSSETPKLYYVIYEQPLTRIFLRQCHRLPICFLTSDFTNTIRNKNQRTLIMRRAGLSTLAGLSCCTGYLPQSTFCPPERTQALSLFNLALSWLSTTISVFKEVAPYSRKVVFSDGIWDFSLTRYYLKSDWANSFTIGFVFF